MVFSYGAINENIHVGIYICISLTHILNPKRPKKIFLYIKDYNKENVGRLSLVYGR